MNFSEAEIIEVVAEIFRSPDLRIELGIGDDAAVVASSGRTVITTDTAVEGTHFNASWSGAFDIGRKITAANLADIYAMGAVPSFLVVALTLTGDESLEWIGELAEGIVHEARSCGASIVGGDLTRGAIKVISITALGEVDIPIVRSGAQVGDSIYLSSLPGWSAAGMCVIDSEPTSDLALHAISEFCAPTVDYSVALDWAHKRATSMCDVSDALIIQAKQIADASQIQFNFDKSAFEKSSEFAQLKEVADSLDVDVWQWIIAGGRRSCISCHG